jgi:pyruvate,water dikinase
MSAPLRLLPLGPAATVGAAGCGAKAARLSAALRAGLPVLPGWVVPAAESRPAVRAAAAVLRRGQPAAGRRAVLSRPLDPALAAELREAAIRLGGRVIVRSSSRLEADPRWSGAFSTVAGVGPDEMTTAVRSCWASAFAVDPLARLGSCGLPLEALELGLLIQPEICPAAGGMARVVAPAQGGVEVVVEGTEGHPGALLAGWADGASARVSLPVLAAGGPLLGLLGRDLVISVARLAARVHRRLGDQAIEWAAGQDGQVWLLQARPEPAQPEPADPGPPPASAGAPPGPDLAARERMPLLSAAVRQHGRHLRGRPAVAGQAAGRLVPCRPHERPPAASRDAILLIERPRPALAPLLFTARGVLARSGAAGSHLAEVARSLSVPMVIGCHPETVTGTGPPGAPWLAAIDGTTGDVALFPG